MTEMVRLVPLSAQALASAAIHTLTGGLALADFEDSMAHGGGHRCVLAGNDLIEIVHVTWQLELIVGIVTSHRRQGVASEAC